MKSTRFSSVAARIEAVNRGIRSATKAGPSAFAALMLGACAGPDLTVTLEPQAMQTALTRGRFEMNCPAATGTVLQKQVLEPLIQGPYLRGGPQRAQFTIGLEGCGQRTTMVVVCSDENTGCFAGVGR